MKAFIVSMMLVAGAVSAQAGSFIEYGAEQEVEYLSWCEDNAIVSIDDKGQVYQVANCTEQALTCKITKRYFSAKTLVTASCKAL